MLMAFDTFRRLSMTGVLLLAAFLPDAASAEPPPSIWITLGTGGGPVVRVGRSEPANALVVGDAIYLFDVGNGVLRQMAATKLKLQGLRAIFISHHHIDHNADLGVVLINRWLFDGYAPLPVIGPPGTTALADDLIKAYRATELAPISVGGPKKPPLASTAAANDMPAELTEPLVVYQDKNIRVQAITNDHYHFPEGSEEQRFSRSYALRIEAPDRTFVYTGDTGPSKGVERLAQGADVLVSEVIDIDRMRSILQAAKDIPPAVLPGKLAHMQEDHLTPVEAGKLAAVAGVKQLVLTHLVPGMDGETDLSGYTKDIATHFSGPVRLAKDLDRF
jgi:ribonuclease BN (tRNA processing enzyme)